MRSVISVFKNSSIPGQYQFSLQPASGRSMTNRTAGSNAGDAAAKAVSIAIANKPAVIVASPEVMKLIPEEFK